MNNQKQSNFGIGLVLLMVLLGLAISTVCSGQGPPGTHVSKIYAVNQGQTLLIPLNYDLCAEQVLKVFEKTYRCRPDNHVLIGVHMAQKPGSYELKSLGSHALQTAAIIDVEPVDWPQVRQNPPRLRTADAVTRNLERAEIGGALTGGQTRYPDLYLVPSLRKPLEVMETTGEFGRIRVFTDTWTDQHKGKDERAATGTKVMSVGDGIVMTAKLYSSEGNLIVLYHGDGVYSLYMHLDEMFVQEGERVHSGQTIALSGDTGNSGGPHLHWAIYVNQKKVDPDSFIDTLNWAMTAELPGGE